MTYVLIGTASDVRLPSLPYGYVEEVPAMDPVTKDRLLTYADGKVLHTPEAVPLARVVAAVFDTYLCDSTARHSVAV